MIQLTGELFSEMLIVLTCQTLLNPCIFSLHTKRTFFIAETNCQEDTKNFFN